MSDGIFQFGTTRLHYVTAPEIAQVQAILDHAVYYHSTIVKYPATGMAQRCFYAKPPEGDGSRVFKRFFLVDDSSIGPGPLAAIDLYVGFPNYKTASIAMCVIRDEYQRKGLGRKILTEALPGFLRDQHPAVQFLSVSLTDNNVPALRCLLSCQYERTNRWEKLDIKGRPITAVTYQKSVRETQN